MRQVAHTSCFTAAIAARCDASTTSYGGALYGRELAACRPHASHVRGPALGGLAAHVGQEQVVATEQTVVALVVQHLAEHGDDRIVRASATSSANRRFHFGAHLVLALPRPRTTHARAVCALRNQRGKAQLSDRSVVMAQPKVDDRIAQLAITALPSSKPEP